MTERQRGLGRGLSALLEEATAEQPVAPPTAPSAGGVRHLPIELIRANADQPRKHFDADELVLDSDFLLFAAAYDTVLCPSAPDPCDADLTLDGLVDDTDFLVFVSAYNHVFCD